MGVESFSRLTLTSLWKDIAFGNTTPVTRTSSVAQISTSSTLRAIFTETLTVAVRGLYHHDLPHYRPASRCGLAVKRWLVSRGTPVRSASALLSLQTMWFIDSLSQLPALMQSLSGGASVASR